MAVNVIEASLLAAIAVMSGIMLRNQGEIMATQDDLVREVNDLKEAWNGVVEYITDQDARIENLRTQLAAAQANTPPETDLSPLVELVDEIQTHRAKLSEKMASPATEGATDSGVTPLPTAEDVVESSAGEPVSTDAEAVEPVTEQSETATPNESFTDAGDPAAEDRA